VVSEAETEVPDLPIFTGIVKTLKEDRMEVMVAEGGHIIVKGNTQIWTLLPLKYRKHIKAGHGEHGRGQ
jgi:hypothetical protein